MHTHCMEQCAEIPVSLSHVCPWNDPATCAHAHTWAPFAPTGQPAHVRLCSWVDPHPRTPVCVPVPLPSQSSRSHQGYCTAATRALGWPSPISQGQEHHGKSLRGRLEHHRTFPAGESGELWEIQWLVDWSIVRHCAGSDWRIMRNSVLGGLEHPGTFPPGDTGASLDILC
ncbi:calcium channel voltage-dependent L type Cav1.4, alpha 1f subunit [Platysternon megacephalum]|uniref:Calcium channel voltage-dependent L type Cav1.4, alpha 1f subunit n=1 Tax=Platysternon megacephalum TaxID=55544 RepID=A0A4D9DM32_9SAUR|nr:calcium channel voltage-dependent L type Cav1.4, alpha 1f subunit [Platysternon megacephalum]